MKKRMILLILALFIIISGCEKNEKFKRAADMEEIVDRIKTQLAVDLTEKGIDNPLVDGQLEGYEIINIKTLDENSDLIKRLNINKSDLQEGYIISAKEKDNSNEIIILQANELDNVERLQKVLEAEKEDQIAEWQTSTSEQYEKVEKNVITTNHKFLLYVTYDKPKKIIIIFDYSM